MLSVLYVVRISSWETFKINSSLYIDLYIWGQTHYVVIVFFVLVHDNRCNSSATRNWRQLMLTGLWLSCFRPIPQWSNLHWPNGLTAFGKFDSTLNSLDCSPINVDYTSKSWIHVWRLHKEKEAVQQLTVSTIWREWPVSNVPKRQMLTVWRFPVKRKRPNKQQQFKELQQYFLYHF